MTVTLPALNAVAPGDPITAELMNSILTSLTTLRDYLNQQRGTLAVTVQNQADNTTIRDAVVTVEPTGADAATRTTRAGVYVGADVQAYLVDSLTPGAYNVTAEAANFNAATSPLNMTDAAAALTIKMAVSVALSPIPNLLGMALSNAVATIPQQGFTIARIIDSHGNDLNAGQLPAEVQPLPVLGQWPLPGTLAPANAAIFIQSSARADYIQKVAVPDLSGLTLDAAKALLAANNLTLGTATEAAGPPVSLPDRNDRKDMPMASVSGPTGIPVTRPIGPGLPIVPPGLRTQIPSVQLTGIDNTLWTTGIDQTVIGTIQRPVTTIVVRQDPPAGTEVPFGTPVNITLASLGVIPLGVLKNTAGLAFSTVGDFQAALGANPALMTSVSSAASFQALSAADQAAFTTFATQHGATDAAQAFGAAKIVASL